MALVLSTPPPPPPSALPSAALLTFPYFELLFFLLCLDFERFLELDPLKITNTEQNNDFHLDLTFG